MSQMDPTVREAVIGRLTEAQRRIYDEVMAEDGHHYGGAQAQSIKALEDAELVTVEWNAYTNADDIEGPGIFVRPA